MNYDMDAYKTHLKERLTKKRYKHSVNVCERAVELAKLHGADPDVAAVAGLLHDIAKDDKTAEQLQIIEKGGIILSCVEQKSPNLYHAIAGSVEAKRLFSIEDTDILNAIRYHTSARANMSTLEKIIYLADLTSSDRKYNNVKEIIKLSDKNLDAAMYASLKFIVGDLVDRALLICTDTISAYNEYCEKMRK